MITRNNDSSYEISYVIVLDMAEEQGVRGLTDGEIEKLERKNM